ncbi:MAG TPA: NUDIX domain-containing protein [Candidatus Acidoferrales bacterium]|nr:NUDIX domain-containing protein [Candidatus Acidoferrales bacterium]
MRKSLAAFALIQHPHSPQPRWLGQWNRKWGAYNLVGGHKKESESFNACCCREIQEELNLYQQNDFIVELLPMSRLAYTAWSASKKCETAYEVELFQTRLLHHEALQRIDLQPANRWLTVEEIHRKLADNGEPVSYTIEFLMEKARLLEPIDLWRCDEEEKSPRPEWH